MMSEKEVLELYGARYVMPDEGVTIEDAGLYYYEMRVRCGLARVERGDCAFTYDPQTRVAKLVRGPAEVHEEFLVTIRGYAPEDKTRLVGRSTYLPYVNGCSTKQIFPPERMGDPTFQYLDIPPYSAEQAHHIHSTTRVVYIAEGKGVSIIGMEGRSVETELLPGMVCILKPMCPHHFATPQGEHLICLPVHVWSSSGPGEFNHPMFNGTHLMNQG